MKVKRKMLIALSHIPSDNKTRAIWPHKRYGLGRQDKETFLELDLQLFITSLVVVVEYDPLLSFQTPPPQGRTRGRANSAGAPRPLVGQERAEAAYGLGRARYRGECRDLESVGPRGA